MISSVWPHEPLVLSTWWIYLPVEIQFLCNVLLMMIHMVTVRTTIGMTNSSPLLSFKVQVPYETNGILDGQSRCNKQNHLPFWCNSWSTFIHTVTIKLNYSNTEVRHTTNSQSLMMVFYNMHKHLSHLTPRLDGNMTSLWTPRRGSADSEPHRLCAAGFFQ